MEYTYISNEGLNLFLYRQGGNAVQFTSTESCALFLQTIKDGRVAMVDAIVNRNIFRGVDSGSATAIVNDYFAQQSAFYMIGTADDFQANEHGASTLEDAFPALSQYISAVLTFAPLEKTVELNRADPAHADKIAKLFRDLRVISQDPVKKSEWLKEHAAVRAKREIKDPLPIAGVDKPMGNPMWSLSTFNGTKQKLTFDGNLPLNLPDDYTIVQQPQPSFDIGLQTFSWYSNVPWFAYGGNGASMVWKTITGRKFGITIEVPLVYFGVGSDPYYLVWRDDFEHWFQPPGGPSAPYTFSGGSGYNVQVTPTCGGKELFVQMHMEVEKGGSPGMQGESKV